MFAGIECVKCEERIPILARKVVYERSVGGSLGYDREIFCIEPHVCKPISKISDPHPAYMPGE